MTDQTQPTADADGRIAIADERDLALLRIAQGSLMNSTVLPSGYKTPAADMLVDGTALVPATAEQASGFRRSRCPY